MQRLDQQAYREFLELQGHQVIQTSGTLWVNVRRKIFQPAPPFHFQENQAKEASEVVRQARGIACRWFTPFHATSNDDQPGSHAAVYLLRPPYDLARLQPKARNQTRRGLERVQVRSVKFDASIEQQAFPVYGNNVGRLGLFRNTAQLNQRWGQWARTLSRCRCTEFWGAWVAERLIAFAVVVFSPWGAEIVCQRSLASHLSHYPNNALVYRIALSVLQRGVAVLSYGLGEFGPSEGSLDHFKRGMAFEELRLQEHYRWHTLLGFLNPVATPQRLHQIARFLKRWNLTINARSVKAVGNTMEKI